MTEIIFRSPLAGEQAQASGSEPKLWGVKTPPTLTLPHKGGGNEETLFLGVANSLTGRKWVLRAGRAELGLAEQIMREHGVPLHLAHVLATRGVSIEDVEAELNPSIKRLMPDPSTLTDMDKLVTRLAHAITENEPIALFGDYDVDGACSVALMLRYLRAVGREVQFHIPDRLTEGYGPNIVALEKLKSQGASLVVTLDCGTTSFEAFARAKELGLDILVIDHHLADTTLPETAALVNPNRQDDLSGLGYLCAAGVTFMVLVALNRVLRAQGFFSEVRSEPDLMTFTDLVALATIADVVPLDRLNRAFVYRGLELIRRRESVGLRALQDIARMSGPAEPYHLAFILGPRINAGGRIGKADLGTRLLICEDEAEAMEIAQMLDRLNQERQIIEQAALEEAKTQAEEQLNLNPDLAVLIVAAPNWHPGVVGLIAARLKEQYNRPSFAIAFEGEKGVGSGRSLTGVDLGKSVRHAVAASIISKGGGHAMAAGVTLERHQLESFRLFMEQECGEAVKKARAERSLRLDGLMMPQGLTAELVASLQKTGPFGSGRPEPLFALADLKLLYADPVAGRHLRLTLQSADGQRLKAMAFRVFGTSFGERLQAARGKRMHVAVNLTFDNWQGRQDVSLRLVDAAI